jgi:hypothetical protein
MHVHVCETAQSYSSTPRSNAGSQVVFDFRSCSFLCMLFPSFQTQSVIYYLPRFTVECCVVSWAIFLPRTWKTFRFRGPKCSSFNLYVYPALGVACTWTEDGSTALNTVSWKQKPILFSEIFFLLSSSELDSIHLLTGAFVLLLN